VSSDAVSLGAIIGGSMGAAVVLCMAIFLFVAVYIRKRRRQQQHQQSPSNNAAAGSNVTPPVNYASFPAKMATTDADGNNQPTDGPAMYQMSPPSIPGSKGGPAMYQMSPPSVPSGNQGASMYQMSTPSVPGSKGGPAMYQMSPPSVPSGNQGASMYQMSPPSVPSGNQQKSMYQMSPSSVQSSPPVPAATGELTYAIVKLPPTVNKGMPATSQYANNHVPVDSSAQSLRGGEQYANNRQSMQGGGSEQYANANMLH
jgi:hypothetical protein